MDYEREVDGPDFEDVIGLAQDAELKRCINCKFFERNVSNTLGICRYNPPSTTTGQWPSVDAMTDWCRVWEKGE